MQTKQKRTQKHSYKTHPLIPETEGNKNKNLYLPADADYRQNSRYTADTDYRSIIRASVVLIVSVSSLLGIVCLVVALHL